MAVERSEIKTVKELNEALKVGESYIAEAICCCPEYPNIPKQVWHVKTEKISDGTLRIIPWD